MTTTQTQFQSLLRWVDARLRLPLAVLAVGAGVLLAAHAMYLGWYRPGMLAGVQFGYLLPGLQMLLGVALSTVGLLSRKGDTTVTTAALLAVGMLVVALSPASPLSLGLVLWTVTAGVTLVCVGLPALLLVGLGRNSDIEQRHTAL